MSKFRTYENGYSDGKPRIGVVLMSKFRTYENLMIYMINGLLSCIDVKIQNVRKLAEWSQCFYNCCIDVKIQNVRKLVVI